MPPRKRHDVLRRSQLVVGVLLFLAASCGGGDGGGTLSSSAPSTHATNPTRPSEPPIPLYLRQLKADLDRLHDHLPATVRALHWIGRWPVVPRPVAADALSRAAGRFSQTSDAIEALRSPPTLRVARMPLADSLRASRRAFVHAAAALHSEDAAVSRRNAAKAEALFGAASRQALAWQARLRKALRLHRVDVPSWLSSYPSLMHRFRHAARAMQGTPLDPGTTGPRVRELQQRLATLRYLPAGYGTATYDYATLQAVIAFQGWQGLPRDGTAGPLTLTAIDTADRPSPWSTRGDHLEVHLTQQVLLIVAGGEVVRAIHVSTGASGHPTPTGSFAIYRKEAMSWSEPFQVWMPLASYFTGGYALHEYPDVPTYPASHGCIRVPSSDSLTVWKFAAKGTTITIR